MSQGLPTAITNRPIIQGASGDAYAEAVKAYGRKLLRSAGAGQQTEEKIIRLQAQ
jgi:hypothetical protein